MAPERLFDTDAVYAEIEDLARTHDEASAFRGALVRLLLARRKAGMALIEEAFTARPFDARPTTRAYSWLTDCIVVTALHAVKRHLHPLSNPTEGERLSVLAVGGSGRGEMAPYSDVDLLFLTPYKTTPWAEAVVESMLYVLWDLHLKVGHATRTIRDCLRLGAEDMTIRTAMLEHRFLAGDAVLAGKLHDRLFNDLFQGSEREFTEAKLAERDSRHEKQGQRYMVEPNVKEGKGGLRDLQSLYWIAKYLHGVQDAGELVGLGLFTDEEFAVFARASEFLWATRCHMHLITGRPTEQLTFDLQVEVAARMDYSDHGGRRAVEHFMQDYFRHATSVGDLTRIFLAKLEAENISVAPMLRRFFRRTPRLRKGFRVVTGRLSIADEDEFLSDPINLLRLFQEALRTGLLIHPDAMRLVPANLALFNDELRRRPEANRIFFDTLLKYGNPERALRRMNELGLLSAFLPEFEPIVAMMQFNMYHSYTVDEHTIQCIKVLSEIEHGDLVEELPVASSILNEGVNRKIIYTALLLHDIGKGREEDHSVLGAQIARKVAPRLGLKPKEAETVEWLVRYHLLMSDMAQKRDIADPRTVRDFAKAVQTKERLDLLCVLTVCDIRGVGPNVWNNWKAALLRALYRQTRRAMDGGLEALNREQRGSEAKRNLRAALSDWSARELRAETGRHYPPYWQGLHVTAHVVFARLLREVTEGKVAIDLQIDEDRDATRACFVMEDHPGIFSRIAGALALVGANVVDARTYTTKDGYATAAFWIQDGDQTSYEADRLPRLTQMIHKTLRGEVVAREAIKSKDKLKKREKAFRVPTSITFDNDGSDIFTLIEVDTRDRPGLLYDLTRTLSEANVYISSAVIATYGAQAVDTFYVKDMFGLKFQSLSKQKSLERKLRTAIEQGTKRALS
ncbi:UTP--GlnB (protein PII) uridylyltransferase, GlnD [Poseidonocella sedimentorum]|uniref:Bifunctional uridylyltransferase/uridylyl-removing enzyme n=1 Tax=Poseidonocella sedimentorum TaxID=871652 RepID=A0A1I6DS88_9RHOB|nr:UTP--GlnB (protein PII) uridylyltransferase, GlnD [Poseidonocella sedimentorum]